MENSKEMSKDLPMKLMKINLKIDDSFLFGNLCARLSSLYNSIMWIFGGKDLIDIEIFLSHFCLGTQRLY